MKRLRKVIFWCHLPVGVLGGIVILIMCVTGTLLTYEKQITSWADTRGYQSAPPTSGATRLPVETIIAKAREARGAAPSAVVLRASPYAPAEVAFGRETTLFLNPYSGQILGDGSPRVRNFFRGVTDWHRWLGAQGDNRKIARAITGACNLGFLFLVASGFYLWWPQKWTKKLVRNVTWFRRGLPARTRDFNWHNVIGFWSAVPLFVVVLSGVVISYTWAGNLVYRVVGESPPTPRPSQPQGTPAAPRRDPGQTGTETLTRLDASWARAEQQVPGWQSITLQLPATSEAPLTFTIDQGNGGQPQKRSQLTLDRTTTEVVRWEPFSASSRGRQLRSILRFSHTGEVAGVAGQTLAGLVSAGGAVLVWTGLALAWRRLRGWLGRRSRSATQTVQGTGKIVSASASD
jgi:uncharacterized iron-regulated membrane protein